MFRAFDAHRGRWLSSPHRRWPFAPSSAHHYHIHKIAFTRFEAHTRHTKVAAAPFTILLKQEMRCNAINYSHYYLFTCSINLLHEWKIHTPKPTYCNATGRSLRRAECVSRLRWITVRDVSHQAMLIVVATIRHIHPFCSHETSATVCDSDSQIQSFIQMKILPTFSLSQYDMDEYSRTLRVHNSRTPARPYFNQCLRSERTKKECWIVGIQGIRHYYCAAVLLGFSHCRRCHGSPTLSLLLGVKIKFFRLHLQ